MLYNVDDTVEVVLPEEQKTDYALLCVLCHLVQSDDTEIPPADVIRSRDYAVRFCSGLLVKAAQCTTNSIEERWSEDKPLRDLFEQLFVPPFTLRSSAQLVSHLLNRLSAKASDTSATRTGSSEPPATQQGALRHHGQRPLNKRRQNQH